MDTCADVTVTATSDETLDADCDGSVSEVDGLIRVGVLYMLWDEAAPLASSVTTMCDVNMLNLMLLLKVAIVSRFICFAGVIAGATAWRVSGKESHASCPEMPVIDEGIGIRCDAFCFVLLPLGVDSAGFVSVA